MSQSAFTGGMGLTKSSPLTVSFSTLSADSVTGAGSSRGLGENTPAGRGGISSTGSSSAGAGAEWGR